MTPAGPASVFIGRQRELHTLLDHAHRARSGSGAATVLVGGDAGVGKSRLIAEFADRVAGGRVVAGGCLELGVDGVPFAPFVAVLRQLLRDRGRGVFDALARRGGPDSPQEPVAAQELARLLPELGAPPEDRREPRGLLFEQVLRLLTAVAGDEGLTVVVEDLHWADTATRDLLVFLLRNLGTAAVQIVATYRSDDLHRGHPLRRLLLELERLPSVTRLKLDPLTPEQAAEQAAAVRGRDLAPDEAAALFDRTGGNPLFVESLAGQRGFVGAGLPERPRELLLASLDGLDDAHRQVLRVAAIGAVSAAHIEHDLLARVAGRDEDDLDTALRVLVDTNALRIDGTGYRFRHALLREAVHGELLPGEHARLHLRFAEALDALPGAVPVHRLAAEQAHHYYSGRDVPRALSAAWRAAVRASETLAFGEELRMLERVLEQWEDVPDAAERVEGLSRVQVVSRAAAAAIEGGDFFRARTLCDAGLAEIPEDAEQSRVDRAVLLRRRGQARTQLSDGDGISDFVEAMSIHPPHDPGYGFVLSLLAREVKLHQQPLADDHPEWRRLQETAPVALNASDLAAEAIRRSRESGDTCAESDALTTLGTVHMNDGRFEEGRALVEHGLDLARERQDPTLECRGLACFAHYLRERGLHGEAGARLEAALERLRAIGLMSTSGPFVALNLAETRFDTGDLAECRRLIERAMSWSPSPAHRMYLATAGVRAAVAQGDLEGARRSAAFIEGDPATLHSRIHMIQLSVGALLDLYLAEQDFARALALAGTALERIEFERSTGYGWVVADRIAETVRQAAERPQAGSPDAEAVREKVLRVAAAMRADGPVQTAFRATTRARLACARGTSGATAAETAEAWSDAVQEWNRVGMPLHRAEALLLAAESALTADRSAQVGDRLREVAKRAAEHGAAVLEGRARELARRAGVALDDGGSSGGTAQAGPPAGLTPREAEVLRLLARGRTNAGIAAELFIAPKTASVHVSHILAKLDLPNRASAGARAHELGLV
ncbi:helix-turn-helix transcriptional regulator [Streptomonospora salina]|uniref:DNA-binding CsgD family transcriptional regulator/tetratricopeptide (TPR) repeat protein n=1 Tax=Streptomonospora salina TaxID=104205 RepID=A0A841EBQ6_9ACTN|nr:AAA family ATPase [Streptomonospora salina]MBB5996881.1 DNA-binding CsgD family transcriptional regulator/tetratricopeptide (TPR) repeat protein [Streptomonospora salina]